MPSRKLNIEARVRNKASGPMAKISKGFGTMADAIKKAGKAAGIVAGAAAAGGTALYALAVKASEAGDKAYVAASRLGTTTDFITQLEFATRQAGVSMGSVEKGLANLAKTAGTNAKMFNDWGISVKSSGGGLKDVRGLLSAVSERINKTTNRSEQLAIAMELMGRAGREMIPILTSTKGGLDDMAARADALGITIRQTSANLANEFQNQLGASKDALAATARIGTEAFLPFMIASQRQTTELVGKLNQWLIKNQEVIRSGIVEFLTWIADSGIPAVATGISFLSKIWFGWTMVVDTLGVLINKFFAMLLKGVDKALSAMGWLVKYVDKDMGQALKNAAQSAGNLVHVFDGMGEDAKDSLQKTLGKMHEFDRKIGDIAVGVSSNVRNVIIEGLKELEIQSNRTTEAMAGAGGFDPEAELNKAKKKTEEEDKSRFFKVRGPKEAAKEEEEELRDGLESIRKDIQERFASPLSEAFRALVEKTKSFRKTIEDLGKSIAENLITAGFKMLLNALTGGASSVISNLLGFKSGGVVPKKMASGGVLGGVPTGRDNQLILAGSGEAFLPVDLTKRLREVLSVPSAGSTVAQFQGGGVVGSAGIGGMSIAINMSGPPTSRERLMQWAIDEFMPVVNEAVEHNLVRFEK